ncbi:hypothetical protein L249_6785 [Ophiocordyceps polyrhachis-furcata BCC 54312]|uniref:Cytochrome P450 n=1 Tax=Ophiocordyceps polyrhachis-furcata BCC 54312 TaxID=1330021 RepID=A0A367LJS7_9HYPO|nr:hypothetical protein L249_6785 [Ophiocordyceps polyrhachis-furcata BCC 54312]
MILTLLSLPLILVATVAPIVIRLYRAVYHHRQRKALMHSKGILRPPWNINSVSPLAYPWLMILNIKAFAQDRLFSEVARIVASDGRATSRAIIFQRKIICTIEPENIKTMLATEHMSWSYSTAQSRALEVCFGRGIFSANGADWKLCRTVISPCFSPARVNNTERLERHVSRLISQIPRDGATVDLSALFYRFTLDSMTEYFLGEGTCALSRVDEPHLFGDSLGRSLVNASCYVALPFSLPFSLLTNQVKHTRRMHKFLDERVQGVLARRQELLAQRPKPSNRDSLIEALVRESDDAHRIRSQALHVLFASRETSGALLSNLWFFLSRHADVWHKLQAEVATLKGQEPSHTQVEGLKYLRAVIDEVLRLQPIVPYQEKMAVEDTMLPRGGGPDGSAPTFVKKGEVVAWLLTAMHRRRDFYGDDADDFRPERWLDDEATGAKALRPGWEYVPWNGGAHSCLGQQLGYMTAAYATVRLCQFYDRVESRVDGRWREHSSSITMNIGGGKVGLFARDMAKQETAAVRVDDGDEKRSAGAQIAI